MQPSVSSSCGIRIDLIVKIAPRLLIVVLSAGGRSVNRQIALALRNIGFAQLLTGKNVRRNVSKSFQSRAQSEGHPAYKHLPFLQNAVAVSSRWQGGLAPAVRVAVVEEAACRSSVSPWKT